MFQVPAIIKKVETMADGGLRLKVDTNEISGQEGAQVLALKDKFGFFLFKESEIQESDIPELPLPEFKEEKSPSKRLHDVMYIYFKKKHGTDIGFRQFYEDSINQIADRYKEKIDQI